MDSVVDLSERARLCSNDKWRNVLKEAHANLVLAMDAFWRAPTRENLELLNGAWAYAARLYKDAPPEADPLAPLSGVPEAAKLAA